MVGVPGSGKSTRLKHYCKKLAPVMAELGKEYHVASTDDLIEEYAAEKGLTYSEVFSEYINEAQRRFERGIKEAAWRGDDIIVDRTNLTRSARAKILSLVPRYYYRRAVVIGTPPREVLDARLSNRPGKRIPSSVIDRFLATYEEPTLEEGFGYIVRCDYVEKGA
jgi:tRNA uridine 5-carbamoylmethylation protein Kti12